MASTKNSGQVLTSELNDFLVQNIVPDEYQVKHGMLREEQEVPTDVFPDLLLASGDLVTSSVEQVRTNERKKTNISFIRDWTIPLNQETFIAKTGQIGHTTRRLVEEGDGLIVSSLTEDADQHNLGIGKMDQKVTNVDSIFPNKVFKKTRPNVTPEDFRALLEDQTYEETVQGPASSPTLVDGDLEASEEDTTEFRKRTTHVFNDLLDLPMFRTNYKTNQNKQLVVSVRELRVDDNNPYLPSALADTKYTVLGDGNALAEIDTVEELFENRTSVLEIPDDIPDVFKVLFPIIEGEYNETNLIDIPPTFLNNEFYRSETQYDAFNKKVHFRRRNVFDLPHDAVGSRFVGGTEFGGAILQRALRISDDIGDVPVETGLGVVSSKQTPLGNGLFFRETEKWNTATEWKELVGTEVDPRTGIVIGIKKKTIDPADADGGVGIDGYIDIKPYDTWKSIRIASKLNTDSLPAPKTWETTVEHSFPNTLLGATWLWQAAGAPFSYDFDMALVLDMLQGYSGPCRAKITESFSDGPPGAVISPTLFFPQGHMVGFAWGFAADPSSECGTCIGITKAQARTWQIPPSLHDEINIAGGVTLVNGSFTDTLAATTPISLPAPGELITKDVQVEVWRFNVFYRKLIEIYVP